MGQLWHGASWEMARALKANRDPLSALAPRYAAAVGYACNPDKLLDALVLLREARLSEFRPDRLHEAVPGMGCSLVWEAENGRLNGSLQPVSDCQATKDRALQVAATPAGPGAATYDINVPASGAYLLCCRLWAPAPGHVLGVQVDDGPVRKKPLPTATGYIAFCFDPPLNLDAGTHQLTVLLFQPGTRLDLLELIPQARDEGGVRNNG
jgi:hypothetical protein